MLKIEIAEEVIIEHGKRVLKRTVRGGWLMPRAEAEAMVLREAVWSTRPGEDWGARIVHVEAAVGDGMVGASEMVGVRWADDSACLAEVVRRVSDDLVRVLCSAPGTFGCSQWRVLDCG